MTMLQIGTPVCQGEHTRSVIVYTHMPPTIIEHNICAIDKTRRSMTLPIFQYRSVSIFHITTHCIYLSIYKITKFI